MFETSCTFVVARFTVDLWLEIARQQPVTTRERTSVIRSGGGEGVEKWKRILTLKQYSRKGIQRVSFTNIAWW